MQKKVIIFAVFYLANISLFGREILAQTKGNSVAGGLSYIVLEQAQSAEEQIKKPNCIYEIKYDFDLAGKELTVPSGCTLKFSGGHFANGVVNGNNTCVDASPYAIFLNTKLAGTWNVYEAFFEWFGACGDGSTDDFSAIQNGLDSPLRVFKMFTKTYLLGKHSNAAGKIGLNISHPTKIMGTAEYDFGGGTMIKAAGNVTYKTMIQISSPGVELCNLEIVGDIERKRVSTILATTMDKDKMCYELTLKKVSVRHCIDTCIDLFTFLSRLEQVTASFCKRAIYIHGQDAGNSTVEITSTVLTGCFAISAEETGFDIRNLNYSTLVSCAADRNGYNTATNKYTGYPYSFFGCNNVNVLSCGCESSYNSMKIAWCRAININSFTDWSEKDKNTFDLQKQIDLSNSYNITFNLCTMGTRMKGKTFMCVDACKNVRITDCLCRDNTGRILTDGQMINRNDCVITNSESVTF